MSRIIVLFTSICSHKRAKREGKVSHGDDVSLRAFAQTCKLCFSTEILEENLSFLRLHFSRLLFLNRLSVYLCRFVLF